MEEAFYKDVYSSNFNVLRFLGLWDLDTKNPLKKKLFLMYRCFVFLYAFFALILGFVQLHLSRHDFRKVSFNLCTTFLATGILIKNFYLAYLSPNIDTLRLNLFVDSWNQTNPDDVEIKRIVEKRFISSKRTFYYSACVFLLIWLSASLLTLIWGPREVPFSVWLPLNLDDNRHYAIAFCFHACIGSFVTTEAIHAELSLFGLILQIVAQYKILAKNLRKMNELYADSEYGLDTDEYIRMYRQRQLKADLRKCVRRQLQLDEYVKRLEFYYNKAMLLQLGVCLALTVVSGVEVLGELTSLNVKGFYQIGYTVIITYDIFKICSMADILLEARQQLSTATYDILWYKMGGSLQKDLVLVIMSTQVDKSILTAWKIFQLNLTTFLGVLKTTGSWLTLFWQLMRK